MTIREKLGKELIFFDGGTGTILQEQGLKAGELPEIWNIEHREAIVSLHKNYLLAGADILKTNTFGANRLKFPGGEGYDLTEIVTAAIQMQSRQLMKWEENSVILRWILDQQENY